MTDVTPEAVLNAPALEPPQGVTPDFLNPPNKNAYAHATLAIVLTLSTLAVLGRVYARWIYLKTTHVGDYLLVIAYGLCVAMFPWIYKLIASPGLFVDMWNLRVKDLEPFLHTTFILTEILNAYVPFIKSAIALEWLHLFSPQGHRGWVFWASHLVIWINVIASGIFFIVTNIACVPYERTWNKLLPGTCDRADTSQSNVAAGVLNVITDIILLAIPQKTIWNLHMPLKKKLGVSIVFAIGVFACVAAVVRLVFSVNREKSANFTYTFSAVIITALTENLCGILVMCIPAFPKAYAGMNLPKFFSSLRSWSSVERLRRSKKNTDSSWPSPSFSSTRLGPHHYEEIDGVMVPIKKTTTEIRAESQRRLADQPLSDTGILRTTQFRADESFVSDNATESYELHAQHPWKPSVRRLPGETV
ncbi:hypothetical protein F4778DRAFT_753130 [Xylariomycetidae sp. FL2044]|nr:hypothetical protein F4778DRAFT_753130 [Xylariomycetidae sp. FL2044]